ncbi:MAG: 50S ribosomal protein L21 [Acholeplasmatales bacterium]|jgi:large subunit ribosomal protein L21|nr:50S ribosomal protein L21 [Acholeplasmatales bacterium]
MYAIVATGGKQVKLELNRYTKIEKVAGEVGDEVVFDKVLLVSHEDELNLGKPYLEKANVLTTIYKQGREKKIVVFKYRPKKGEKTKRGHRQSYTLVLVKSINL